ncbi:MAG TPA: UDP-N-acetylmuramoyl-L-alanyl-D-glutamate--2,6-diaminopimelate ligase [Thermoanaerobaculia bacterium]|nr:UDP-N-acetylmuramoyl-L-alanyl-D-glutamate--2,6-diaminopimelate ligase [Thermoanaerobaculia bacterium]
MELLSVLPEAEIRQAGLDAEIGRVSHDSRQVRPGDLFVAIRGSRADGYEHVREALRRGAVAVVSDRPALEGISTGASVPWVRVAEPRRALALLAARRAGDPAERLVVGAVTGTNGKTTTTMLLEALLARRHGRSGFLGTVAYRTGRREIAAPRTTPEAPVVQELLAEMVADGVPAAALEVSSHALALERVAGCRFDVTIFTNLTRDHLDFHHDMESYYAAKKRLFFMRKAGASAVVNVDDLYGARLARELEPPVWTYSAAGSAADVRAVEVRCDLNGIRFRAVHARGQVRLDSRLLGLFNVENLLAAAAAGLALGMPLGEIGEACATVKRVPGRLEPVEAGQPYTILVDYAHTEDALRRLLLAVRELTEKRIVLVFGCGGDRDQGKRFPMGEIAGRLADVPIATSDNSRSEDPAAILSEVERGLVASGVREYWKIVDRREAIARAIGMADPGAVVVIAGKGHETTQVIGEKEFPFDDRVVAAELAGRR